MNLKSSTKTDVNMTKLVVEIDAESFEKAVEATYRRQKKNISLPGFRKGKVPRGLCERIYGENVFYEDAINMLLNLELPRIIEESKLELVDAPKVELTAVSKEEGATLKVICVTKPEIHIEGYKGIEAPHAVQEITDVDVDQQIASIRQRNARMISVDDRAAEMGDEVTLDFECFFGDEAFEGGKGEDYQLKLGSGQFIPGFEEQVAGHNLEEDFDVTATFPENYQMEDYAGKEAVFKCRIHGISREELPELDDEFVKDTSEFDTVDEWKADIRKKLEESAVNNADRTFENVIVEKLIEKVEDPIPHCMFERRADTLLNQFASQLKAQGVSLNLYLQYTGMDQDSLKATYLDRAEGEVKLRLALEQIAAQEQIEASDEEVEEEIAKIAEEDNMTADEVKARVSLDDLRMDLVVTKAMDFVKDQAVVTEPAEESAEEPSQEETEAAE
ncbi:MAG: trigger factor [Ruminococcus sp.]|nr:trigger factor [Ruminococcus sp.]